MRSIIIEKDHEVLRYLESVVVDTKEIEVIGNFSQGEEALNFARQQHVQGAILDMDGLGPAGLELVRGLKHIYKDMVILLLVGMDSFSFDILKAGADHYLPKPYTVRELEGALECMRLLAQRQDKQVKIRTFGRFDVFVNDKTVLFTNAKAKELLALCVDHRGGMVTLEEAIDKLWENRVYDSRVKNLYRKSVMYLKQFFRENVSDEIFFSVRGACNIDKSKIQCDFYDLMEGKEKAIREWEVFRSYLAEYSWAEETSANISKYFCLLQQMKK